MERNEVLELVRTDLVPKWIAERDSLDHIDRWLRWDHEDPHSPRSGTKEHKEIAKRSQTPWGSFVVSALARTLYIEGYRQARAPENGRAWAIWQANGLDGHQVAVNTATIGYGVAYGLTLPGRDLTGAPMPVMRGISPRQMIAFYEDPAVDEWPLVAMRIAKVRRQAAMRVYDDQLEHTIVMPEGVRGSRFEYGGAREHGAGVCPVVRFTNRLDLEGRYAGEIEPHIPILARLDQDDYDRLVVQRFSSWVVRTIAGMSPADTSAVTGETPEQQKIRLRVEDLLVASDPGTKFGSLPATPLDGFISAKESDVRVLAAVTASPAHEMLGAFANMNAEALAAARAPQTAKSWEAQHTLGEVYERWLRLAAHVAGDREAAADYEAQVRWKDTEIRSLAQAADALGKLATMLEIPVEVLWEKVPGFTEQDVERARALYTAGDGLESVIRELAGAQTPAATIGAVPSSLRLPAAQADALEGSGG